MWNRLIRMGRTEGQGLVDIVYPPACVLCRQMLEEAACFCSTCRATLCPENQTTCFRCAATVGPHTPTRSGCPLCRNERFAFERVIRLGVYDGLLRRLVLRLKHAKGEWLAVELGRYWGTQQREIFAELQVEAIIPVPLYWWRRWVRGYNQSAALASGLSEVLGLPTLPGILRRIRHTPPQMRQSPTSRRDNVRDAFVARCSADWLGRSVLLVDDVLTTGSTAHEATRALQAAGLARVVVAALSRAGLS